MELTVNQEAFALLAHISHFLDERNIQSYLIGGFVRDTFLGREMGDIDIAVAGDALEIASEIASDLHGKFVPLDEVNEIGRVVLLDGKLGSTRDKYEFDFSTLRGTIEEDLAQRDFTIDAMAVKLRDVGQELLSALRRQAVLIDPFDGREDLRRGVIRVTDEIIFKSDAARLMRAVRLAAELDFTIDSDTEILIKRDCHFITGVAGERVR